jgi:NAD+ synthase (glutamine-hydrolysing)
MRTVLEQKISPELVPEADGGMQSTEDAIGPYNLNDFFLFHTIREGSAPSRIGFLAHAAWSDPKRGDWPAHTAKPDRVAYDLPTIVKWLEVFAKRFFVTSQFKRSVAPNGREIAAGFCWSQSTPMASAPERLSKWLSNWPDPSVSALSSSGPSLTGPARMSATRDAAR